MEIVAALAPALSPRNKTLTTRTDAPRVAASGSGLSAKTTNEETDERLVARIVAGDERAFAEIVRRHAGRLRALALGFSGLAAEADDIVQETFWSLWRNAARWQPDGRPLSAYLARIAVNRAIDLTRRRKVRSFFGIEDAADVADSGAAADHRMVAGSELAAVARDLRDLPARQRVAILLAADGAQSNAEIAGTMGLSVGAVEQLLVRARRTLRSRLAARDAEGEGR